MAIRGGDKVKEDSVKPMQLFFDNLTEVSQLPKNAPVHDEDGNVIGYKSNGVYEYICTGSTAVYIQTGDVYFFSEEINNWIAL